MQFRSAFLYALIAVVTAAAYTNPLLSLQQSVAPATMETLDAPFTVEINGSPIATVSGDAEQPIRAKVGPDAAVFTLKRGRLQSGDWVLARDRTENRSLRPKPVFWFKADTENDTIQPVNAQPEGNSCHLTFGGAPLTEVDGHVVADLLHRSESTVSVKLQS